MDRKVRAGSSPARGTKLKLNKMFDNGLIYSVLINNQGSIHSYCKPYFEGYINTNPSIYNDNGRLLMNVRCVNYILHHSLKYPSWSGQLQYIHKENDVRLASENYIVELDKDLNEVSAKYVDMKLNTKPGGFNFHGLEDGRLLRWDNKLYLSGVRRDTTVNGQGRIELTEIEERDTTYEEVSRYRIEVPNTYCEKNWMPILDQPYNYMRWIDEKVDINNLVIDEEKYDRFRGNSHVIRYKDCYIGLMHSFDMTRKFFGEKHCRYENYFVMWDDNFNIISISEPFRMFNESYVEFTCGICMYNDDLLISFSDTDNACFLLKVNADWLVNQFTKNV